jgi:isoleucyl-tRNA synthetase
MHCWRHKTPLIYRATAQWFVGMDKQPTSGDTLRDARSKPSKTPSSSRPGARRACTR